MKYEQIFIKSEADLPKELGMYLTEFGWLKFYGKWQYPETENRSFTRGIDWYLLPLPSDDKQEKPSASISDIMKYLSDNGIGTGTNLTVRSTAGLIQGFIAQWVLPAQSPSKESYEQERAAEEYRVKIRKSLINYKNDKEYTLHTGEEDILYFMKEFASQSNKVNDLRSELIKWMEWYYEDCGGVDQYTIKHLDDYLRDQLK